MVEFEYSYDILKRRLAQDIQVKTPELQLEGSVNFNLDCAIEVCLALFLPKVSNSCKHLCKGRISVEVLLV